MTLKARPAIVLLAMFGLTVLLSACHPYYGYNHGYGGYSYGKSYGHGYGHGHHGYRGRGHGYRH